MGGQIDVAKRDLIRGTAIAGATIAGGLILPSALAAKEKKDKKGTGKNEGEVTPPEDLMREHGVLDRLLLLRSRPPQVRFERGPRPGHYHQNRGNRAGFHRELS